MKKRSILACAAVLLGWTMGYTQAERGPLMPPSAPRHAQRTLDTASALAADLAETVAFLEQGQSYFKAFQKGTHTAEENTAMLRFLQDYERERNTALREGDVLHSWLKQKSELESAEPKSKGL